MEYGLHEHYEWRGCVTPSPPHFPVKAHPRVFYFSHTTAICQWLHFCKESKHIQNIFKVDAVESPRIKFFFFFPVITCVTAATNSHPLTSLSIFLFFNWITKQNQLAITENQKVQCYKVLTPEITFRNVK